MVVSAAQYFERDMFVCFLMWKNVCNTNNCV